MSTFKNELSDLLNKHSKESESNTPDFILANYLNDCLHAFDLAVNERSDWYNEFEKEIERRKEDELPRTN